MSAAPAPPPQCWVTPVPEAKTIPTATRPLSPLQCAGVSRQEQSHQANSSRSSPWPHFGRCARVASTAAAALSSAPRAARQGPMSHSRSSKQQQNALAPGVRGTGSQQQCGAGCSSAGSSEHTSLRRDGWLPGFSNTPRSTALHKQPSSTLELTPLTDPQQRPSWTCCPVNLLLDARVLTQSILHGLRVVVIPLLTDLLQVLQVGVRMEACHLLHGGHFWLDYPGQRGGRKHVMSRASRVQLECPALTSSD